MTALREGEEPGEGGHAGAPAGASPADGSHGSVEVRGTVGAAPDARVPLRPAARRNGMFARALGRPPPGGPLPRRAADPG